MTHVEALGILAAAASAMWNGRLDSWASAGEISRARGLDDGNPAAQIMGCKLASLERAGLFESTREPWGKMWRPSPAVRDLLEPLA